MARFRNRVAGVSVAVLAFVAVASPTAANGPRASHTVGRMLRAAYGPSVTAYSHSRAIALRLWLPHSVYPRDALVLGQVTVANTGKHRFVIPRSGGFFTQTLRSTESRVAGIPPPPFPPICSWADCPAPGARSFVFIPPGTSRRFSVVGYAAS